VSACQQLEPSNLEQGLTESEALTSDGALPVALVNKHSAKVANHCFGREVWSEGQYSAAAAAVSQPRGW
jgi:hypothetical protein